MGSHKNITCTVGSERSNLPIIGNPLKNRLRQQAVLGFSDKKARCETMRAPPRHPKIGNPLKTIAKAIV